MAHQGFSEIHLSDQTQQSTTGRSRGGGRGRSRNRRRGGSVQSQPPTALNNAQSDAISSEITTGSHANQRGSQRGGRARGRGRGGGTNVAGQGQLAGPNSDTVSSTRGRGRGRGRGGNRGQPDSSRGRGGNSRVRGQDRGGLSPAPRAGPATQSAEQILTTSLNGTRRFNTPQVRRQRYYQSGAPGYGHASNLNAQAPAFSPCQPRHEYARPRTAEPAAPRLPLSSAPDMMSAMHEDIENGNYECIICTDPVVRKSEIWPHREGCWAVLHLSCAKRWAQQCVEQAGGNKEDEEWRCPACNVAVEFLPFLYSCWCGKEDNPSNIPGAAPHSCGQTCGKTMEFCSHPCTLLCHAGPCPPCTFLGEPKPCFCARQSSRRMCQETRSGYGWSCGEVCGDLLPCGQHSCELPCHAGYCSECLLMVESLCYCGKAREVLPCETRLSLAASFSLEQVDQDSLSDALTCGKDRFFGSFKCDAQCGRLFDCGKHACEKMCHIQDEHPAHCPLSPDVVRLCPCGQTSLAEILTSPRKTCEDEIPSCSEICRKPLECGHGCPSPCHPGPCGPCTQVLEIHCRCGRAMFERVCPQGAPAAQPTCTKLCRGLLSCGRHSCTERCCPAEKKAAERRKRKLLFDMEYEPEHICPRTCGRLLRCGQHNCVQRCHAGPCYSCPEAIFTDISCPCGRTVLEPPQPCGTQPPTCEYDCTRPMACGHAPVRHNCHSSDTECPKCPALMSKRCMCGSRQMPNQPCWLNDVRCGEVCGKVLKCGHHKCRKTCHRSGECEDAEIPAAHCNQLCGQPRSACGHVCTDTCHAPSPCQEDRPCESKAWLFCPCRHRKQEIRCLASFDNPTPVRKTLECDDECLRLQRNRKLAEALNVDLTTHMDDHIPYSSETLKLYAADSKWARICEQEFRLFAADTKLKHKRFKPMPAPQRAFLHSLAEDFGLETYSEDPEPYRHVNIVKTPKFVAAPMKTVAQSLNIRDSKLKSSRLATIASTSSKQEPFNALFLGSPRFGLTAVELDALLQPVLKEWEKEVTLTTTFLPSGDGILIKVLRRSAAVLGPSSDVERILRAIKPAIMTAAVDSDMVKTVQLCSVDSASNILRREQDLGGKWNTVVSRAAKRPDKAPATPTPHQWTVLKPSSATKPLSSLPWGAIGGRSFSALSTMPNTMPDHSAPGRMTLKLKKKKQESVAKTSEQVYDQSESAPLPNVPAALSTMSTEVTAQADKSAQQPHEPESGNAGALE